MGYLSGIAVLDLSAVGPATRASGWLADYGADVVKVGPIPRGGAVVVPPAHAYSAGRGTQRIQLDLKSDAGRALFLRLAAVVDVVIESFRPGVVDRLGIGYDAVAAVNPGVVYCSTTGFGQSGAQAGWAGHDLDYLAVGGYLGHTERGAGGKPPVPGVTVADTAAGGMQAVMAILAALVARAGAGRGSRLDVSVTDGVIALMSMQIDGVLAEGGEPAPGTAPLDGRFACYDTYRTGDGRWLAVAAIEGVFWRNLCGALQLTEYADRQWDPDSQPEIAAALSQVFASRSRDEWVAALSDRDTCVAPVLDVAEVAGAVRTDSGRTSVATMADGRQFTQLAPLLAGAERQPSYDVPAPGVTQTDVVLRRYGVGEPEIAELRRSGVIA